MSSSTILHNRQCLPPVWIVTISIYRCLCASWLTTWLSCVVYHAATRTSTGCCNETVKSSATALAAGIVQRVLVNGSMDLSDNYDSYQLDGLWSQKYLISLNFYCFFFPVHWIPWLYSNKTQPTIVRSPVLLVLYSCYNMLDSTIHLILMLLNYLLIAHQINTQRFHHW